MGRRGHGEGIIRNSEIKKMFSSRNSSAHCRRPFCCCVYEYKILCSSVRSLIGIFRVENKQHLFSSLLLNQLASRNQLESLNYWSLLVSSRKFEKLHDIYFSNIFYHFHSCLSNVSASVIGWIEIIEAQEKAKKKIFLMFNIGWWWLCEGWEGEGYWVGSWLLI